MTTIISGFCTTSELNRPNCCRCIHLNIQILQGIRVATDLRRDGKLYTVFLRSLSAIATLKELLKSVHRCQSYPKNKSGTVVLWLTITYDSQQVQRIVSYDC